MRNIFGDKNRMTQILVNLVSNSLKFSPTGSQIKLHLQIVNKDLDFDLSKMAINS
jgi:signal transduction histidine kinase